MAATDDTIASLITRLGSAEALIVGLRATLDRKDERIEALTKECSQLGRAFDGEVVRRGDRDEQITLLTAERDALLIRRDELLALVARVTNETPYPDEIKGWTEQRAKLVAEVGTVKAERDEARRERDNALDSHLERFVDVSIFEAVQRERDAYRSMVCDLLASASPSEKEHPTMSKQWSRARELLRTGGHADG